MSGWSAITFEAVEPFDDEDGNTVWPNEQLERIVGEYVAEDPTNIWGMTGRYVEGTFFAELCGPDDTGYRDWEEDRKLLVRTSKFWERAVVIQANDTGDIGEARLFEWAETAGGHRPKQIGSFKEKEEKHGRPVGEFAAAKMYEERGIPCRADYNKPHYPGRHGTAREDDEVEEDTEAIEGLGGCDNCGDAIVGSMDSYIDAVDAVYCDIDCYNEALVP